jgi:cytochrome b pre-mRNA-processing protein 3
MTVARNDLSEFSGGTMSKVRRLAGRLFGVRPEAVQAGRLYVSAVRQAREPVFYSRLDVPDTPVGRFELIALHGFLVMKRLKTEPAAVRLLQAFANAMVDDLDRNLREMGVGDLSVGRKVKQLVQGFYGRMAAYEEGMEAGDTVLSAALQRNLYAGEKAEAWQLAVLTQYLRQQGAALDAQPLEAFLGGAVSFEKPCLPAPTSSSDTRI